MKKLTLVRHAKSDWGTEFLKDIDRPLNERGYRDAYFMSDWYMKHKSLPQLILSSSATRALSTAFIFARTFGKSITFKVEETLYESSVSNALNVIGNTPNEIDHVMLFGHNPFITNLANQLSSELYFENVPTCGIIEFEFVGNYWHQFEKNNLKQIFHQFPKQF